MDRQIIQSIYSHTCAIGWVPAGFDLKSIVSIPDPWIGNGIPLTVIGTGFLVAPQIVVTAEHIVIHLRKKIGIANEQIIVATTIPTDEGVKIYFHAVQHIYELSGKRKDGALLLVGEPHPLLDCAFFSLGAAIPNITGLRLSDPKTLFVGDRIYIAGYFRGHSLLAMRGTATQRFGPIWLTGHLAAITPMGLKWTVDATDYFIDITGARGLSGAAVCTEHGEVIGVVTGGVESSKIPSTETDLVSPDILPMNLVRALPLLPGFMTSIINKIEADVAPWQ